MKRSPTYQNQNDPDADTSNESDYPSKVGRARMVSSMGAGHGMTNQGAAPRASKKVDGTRMGTQRQPGEGKDMTDGDADELPAKGSRPSSTMAQLLASIRKYRMGGLK